MKKIIVHSPDQVVLVGGGEVDGDALRAALEAGVPVVAADGGAGAVLEAGGLPDAVIGDMDSLSPAARAGLPQERIHHVPEQDDTDFDKCLARIDAPLVVGLGFLGKRIDHQLAAMTTLARNGHRAVVLRGGGDLVMAVPPALALDLAEGCRVSLYPMAPVAGRSEGLRWPIDGLQFAPGGRIGTSNVATGPVRLEMDRPGMLIILPEVAWAPLQAALCARPGWWPVPGTRYRAPRRW